MTETKGCIDTIRHEDYLQGMGGIPDGSIDLILTDPPYGVTACPWDKKPDLEAMWREFNRVIKENGAMVITATQPFATEVINANRKWFRYDLVWVKSNPVGHLNARRMPMRQHELILVFYRKLPTYCPQMTPGKHRAAHFITTRSQGVYRAKSYMSTASDSRYPTSILNFKKEGAGSGRHPTQKPLELFKYLIKMYSTPWETVLDPFMGSGTTAVAAIKSRRHFLGFEKDQAYWAMGNIRIQEALTQPQDEDEAESFLPSLN